MISGILRQPMAILGALGLLGGRAVREVDEYPPAVAKEHVPVRAVPHPIPSITASIVPNVPERVPQSPSSALAGCVFV